MFKRILRAFRWRHAPTLRGLEEELSLYQQAAARIREETFHSGILELNFPQGGCITARMELRPKKLTVETVPQVLHLTGTSLAENLVDFLGTELIAGQRIILAVRFHFSFSGQETHPTLPPPPISLDSE